MDLKQIPHSLEAEQGIIASLIIDYQQISEIKEIIQPHHFYNQVNRIIYEELIEAYELKKEVDLIILKDQLESSGKILEIGGIDYVVNIVDAIQTSSMVTVYANIVYEKFIVRQVIEKASNILTEGYQTTSAQNLIEYAEKEIFELSKLTRSADFKNWEEIITDAHQKIIELSQQEKKGLTGLTSGYTLLDKMTNGLQPSDLIILAARPSVGKTAFALNLAKNVAKATSNEKATVAIFSLEMSADQLLHRLMASESTVPISNVKNGELTMDQQQLLSYGVDNLLEMNIYVDDTPGLRIGELKSKARKLKVEKGLDFIVIDYLQLITTSMKTDNRQQEVSEISRELKGLAKELEIPVLALSQLSRGVESRPDKRPMMSDIRESGAIEQDADIIMMLYRPEYHQNNLEEEELEDIYEGKTELIITKHRNGSTGTLEYKFLKETNKFTQVVVDNYDQ